MTFTAQNSQQTSRSKPEWFSVSRIIEIQSIHWQTVARIRTETNIVVRPIFRSAHSKSLRFINLCALQPYCLLFSLSFVA